MIFKEKHFILTVHGNKICSLNINIRYQNGKPKCVILSCCCCTGFKPEVSSILVKMVSVENVVKTH